MMKKFSILGVLVIAFSFSVALSGCSNKDIHIETIDSDKSTQAEQILTAELMEETAIGVDTNTENIEDSANDDAVMYYDMKEVIVEGNRLEASDNADYNPDKLIPVTYYEQSGVKIYAYELEEFDYPVYNLLLEHNGIYQVFKGVENLSFNNIFDYEDNLYNRDFSQGIEIDYDNDNEAELAQIIVQDQGTMILYNELVVFDYNADIGEYELYYIDNNDFKDVIDNAANTFFKEHYGSYNIDEKDVCRFKNGYSVQYGEYTDSFVDESGLFECTVLVFGNPRDDGAMGYDIGSMIFKVDYIGGGKFSVKADRYNEWINIMDTNLE